MRGKGTVFFYLTHSLDFWKTVFFSRVGKKNICFFSEEKFESHSPAKKIEISKKKVKKGQKILIFALFQIFAVFLFISKLVFFFCVWFLFFFSGKVYTSLTYAFSESEKKKTGWKTKTPFSLTNSIFAQKSKK